MRTTDPLGVRPRPATGASARAFLDPERKAAASAFTRAFANIWVKHDAQEIIIARLLKFLEDWRCVGVLKKSGGRRLSQHSQAGKSAAIERLKKVLADLREAEGMPTLPYQLVIVLLKKRTTLKGLYQAILEKMGDPHWDQNVSASTLLKRIEDHRIKIGMEMLVIDEVQHLDNTTRDATQVLDQLKVFVDERTFPVVFVGDEDSEAFFKRNSKFAARLGEPLKLEPLRPDLKDPNDPDAFAFKQFCSRFDKALVKSGAVSRLSGLGTTGMLEGLLTSSGGHVGRVARILEVAAEHSVWRGAEAVEAYDLSHAVREFAIGLKWVGIDPFSRST